MDIQTIESHLKQYEWSFDRVDDNTLAAAFEIDERSFLILFQLIPPWLRMAVPAYLPVPQGEPQSAILLHALTLNHQTRMVRIAIDGRGDFTLCVDMNTANDITFADFETALETLCYTAGALYQQLGYPGTEGVDDGE